MDNKNEFNKVDYWTETSEYDLETAKVMKNGKRFFIPFNIEGRYPDYKQMLYEALNDEKCETIIKETEDFIEWIKKKLDN